MDKSLRSNTNELVGTKAAIKMAMRSPAGSRTVWTIVEGEDDVRLYSRMLNEDAVTIKTSEGEDGKRGYKNVETIVVEIAKEDPNAKIFGIRDRDYTSFECPIHVFPDNIFITDRRDLEMMMFESPSVVLGLDKWTSCFTQAWNKIIPVARFLGYMRICNHVNDYGCVLRNSIKSGNIWDFSTHEFKSSWKSDCAVAMKEWISEDDLEQFISIRDLPTFSDFDICRGHDVVKLLSLSLIRNEYTNKAITNKIIDLYSYDDFRRTNLCSMIESWGSERNMEVLRKEI